jgi:hypothetical protein
LIALGDALHMSTVVSPPESRPKRATRSGGKQTADRQGVREDLLRSRVSLAPATAPAPLRALALDALRLRRGLSDRRFRPVEWGERGFERQVELVRTHLRPLRHRGVLAASFGREAFQSLERRDVRETIALGPTRVAYAIRWLELGKAGSLPAFGELLGDMSIQAAVDLPG